DLQDRSVQVTLVQGGASANAELSYHTLRTPGAGSASPPWLAFVVLVGLLAAGAAVVLRRRRPGAVPAPLAISNERLSIVHEVPVDPTWATLVFVPRGDADEGRTFRIGEAPATIGSSP